MEIGSRKLEKELGSYNARYECVLFGSSWPIFIQRDSYEIVRDNEKNSVRVVITQSELVIFVVWYISTYFKGGARFLSTICCLPWPISLFTIIVQMSFI